MFLFLLHELSTSAGVPDRVRLLEACNCVKEVIDIWDRGSWCLSAVEVAGAVSAWSRFLTLTRDLDELEIPKKHLSMHLVQETSWHGNPRFYATWRDEALNKLLKSTCKFVSQMTFDVSVFSSMRRLLSEEKLLS